MEILAFTPVRLRALVASSLALFVTSLAPPSGGDPDLGVWRAHYAAAEAELLAGDAVIADPAVLARRRAVRAALAEYRERGEFGRGAPGEGDRRFLFVDDGGRRCAVAMLLDRFGGSHVTERVARENNGAMVIDLASDPEVVEWLGVLGITAREAARIQGPIGAAPPEPLPTRVVSHNALANTPGDAPQQPREGASGGASPSSSSPGANAPGAATTGGAAPARGRTTGDGDATAPDLTIRDWWTWWEHNKLDFLLRAKPALPAIEGTYAEAPSPITGRSREALDALVRSELAAGDPFARATAAIALGRIAGADAIEPLVGLLADANVDVRHAALLGLGMTADLRAAMLLLEVAKDGALHGQRVSPDAAALARIALALGRRRGLPGDVDRAVGALANDGVDFALALYPALATTAADRRVHAFERRFDALLADRRAPVDVRARALESLVLTGAPRATSELSHRLGDARAELRRAAATALSESGDPLAYAALATAAEFEAESRTRGLLLVSLGRSGPAAESFLIERVTKGRRSDAAFAALGLGIALRQSDSLVGRAALREAARNSRSTDARGAFALALGISRDHDAVPWLASLLDDARNAEVRSFAAQALGMIGTDAAHRALVARVGVERQGLAVVGLAHGLAQFGREDDVPMLAELLERIEDPWLANQIAPALVMHDTAGAFELAMRWATDPGTGRGARTAALEALGALADRRPRFAVAALARQSSPDLFPPWLETIWRYTL